MPIYKKIKKEEKEIVSSRKKIKKLQIENKDEIGRCALASMVVLLSDGCRLQ